MATDLQNSAINELKKLPRGKHGKIRGVGKVMIKVGYAEKTAKNPKNLTESVAYLENFNVPKAKETVGNILINGQESNKLKAAQEIFKVEGAYAPEKTQNLSISVDITRREGLKQLVGKVLKELKDGNQST